MIEKLTTTEAQAFIAKHAHEDPASLILKSKESEAFPLKEVVQQIQARQKASHKLPEWYNKEGVIFPGLLPMEQCSSEVTAKFKASLVSGGRAVDLTGGTGVDTYYLSKSFASIDYVEKDPVLCEIAQHNFNVLSATVSVNSSSAEAFLAALATPVDLIYVDPARRDPSLKKVVLLQDCAPDVTSLHPSLMKKANQLLVKASPMLDIQAAEQSLPGLSKVYIVAVNNEVKEVLYLVENAQDPVTTFAINLNKTTGAVEQAFSFSKDEEMNASPSYSLPGRFIYEPNRAVLKAGAFKTIAARFRLGKLHPNSHLYTSDKRSPFPGRTFELIASVPYNKKAILEFLPHKKANIAARNFPDTVHHIRKKTGIKEGGDIYLFATTNREEKLVVLICRKTPNS